MDHLQTDIDSLESERGALREKLKGYSSKKGDLKASTAFGVFFAKDNYVNIVIMLLLLHYLRYYCKLAVHCTRIVAPQKSVQRRTDRTH